MRVWKDRIGLIFKEIESIPREETSSRFEHDKRYWSQDEDLNIGKIVGWIFTKEEKGLRMKR